MIKNDCSKKYIDYQGREFLKKNIVDDNYPFYHLVRGVEKNKLLDKNTLRPLDTINLRLEACKISSITFKKNQI